MMGEIGTLVIGGPTASGKSALAQHIAASIGGVIINADSMQLYRELRILTARPTPQEEALLPHRLFGVLSADQPSSVGRWLELARVAIDEAASGGQPAIVVGGTGLYLYALLHGLAAVPTIPSEVRAEASKTYDELGGQEFHRALSALDPKMAE
ncbi:MAG: isopentenyl transferase family protein, partial [Pseudomonadota bacterium]